VYIPILKSRMYENILLRDYSYLFNNINIKPYIEIISLKIARNQFDEESINIMIQLLIIIILLIFLLLVKKNMKILMLIN